MTTFSECHMCHTCRHALAAETGAGLWCVVQRCTPSGHRCAAYEREAGADMPEDPGQVQEPTLAAMLRSAPRLSREDKRDLHRERQ